MNNYFSSNEDINDQKREKLKICKKHNQNIEKYCEKCSVIVCHTCCILEHHDHDKPINLICEICGPDGNTTQSDKRCVECNQFMCESCSKKHVRSTLCTGHHIVDINDENKHFNKLAESFCTKHKQILTLYCNKCEVRLCPNCCNEEHSDHAKQGDIEGDLEKVFADIETKESNINTFLAIKIKLLQKFKELETNCPENYNEVRNAIKDIASEIKMQINDITDNYVLQIDLIEKQSLNLIRNYLNEINDSINLMEFWQKYYTDLLSDETNHINLNSKPKLYKINWIEEKSKKELKTSEVTFEISSIKEISLHELLKVFKIEAAEASIDSEVGDVWCQNCKQKFDAEVNILPCDHQLCKNCVTTENNTDDIDCDMCGKRCNRETIKNYIIEPWALNNYLINIVPCSKCRGNYDEVHTLPCLHQFCQKCTKKMEDCFLCYKSFDKEKVQINVLQPSNNGNVKRGYFDVLLEMINTQKQPVLLKLKQPHNENRDVFNLKQTTEIKTPLPKLEINNRNDSVNMNILDKNEAIKMDNHDSNEDINKNMKYRNKVMPLMDTSTGQYQECGGFDYSEQNSEQSLGFLYQKRDSNIMTNCSDNNSIKDKIANKELHKSHQSRSLVNLSE